ncbi:hypothetical protein K1719_020125 [Acacia pycnantha]|nr:hypothetical protein K1719_020125 [Acacia pycnantha]
MWRLKDPLKLIPLSNGYYIVSFSNKEDREYAFHEGPWMIEDHYLIVQRWRPNFNPWKADLQCNIAAWIRLPDVPFEFYNVESLRRIGNMVGKMIKVDRSTSVYDKGSFAHICVEIDLKKPLLPTYTVFGEERPIVYEGLHQVCFVCGKYGHKKESVGQEETAEKENVQSTAGPEVGDSNGESASTETGVGGSATSFAKFKGDLNENPKGMSGQRVTEGKSDLRRMKTKQEIRVGVNENKVEVASGSGSGKAGPVVAIPLVHESSTTQAHLILEIKEDNGQGTGARSFPSLIRDLKAHYHLGFIAILEARCNTESSVARASQLGFLNMELINCEGYSGGIWCLWDHCISSVSVVKRHHQFLHLLITNSVGSAWTMTVVYASPSCGYHRVLWEQLAQLVPPIQGPWLVGGDLNSTLLFGERWSAAKFKSSTDQDFLTWVENHDMRDMGFVDPKFTWKRGGSEARLDRMLGNAP